MIYPSSFEQKIGFDRIRELLVQKCQSSAAKDLVDSIVFYTSAETLNEELFRTDEMRVICMMETGFPGNGYEDTLTFLRQLELIPTYYPDLPSLRKLQASLGTVRSIVNFFSRTHDNAYPYLKQLCQPVVVYPAILQRLDALLDKFGEIRDNASPELSEIRHSIRQKEQAVSRKIQVILKSGQEQGLIDAEASVSMRDGRVLIPVPASNKKKIEGYIYDESASGKTVFIEPAEIVNLNNQIRELYFAEQREIVRILIQFADFLRPYAPDLIQQAHFLASIDFLRAKAALAAGMQAGKPVLSAEPGLFLQRARHPLLQKALEKENKEIIPLTLRLDANKRILLISGPNAGGKSVCLKTVGLLQYMLQCGLLVPASETSEFGLFSSIFIDIGDEQSIENDLSTYSSHLKNMREILEHADAASLILIDEFGAGTEPAAGGAIAEALLERWEVRGCFGVITTHYTNLKFFATASQGVLNGAMQFDVQQIKPLFKLETGVPGNSFAFELARKMGMPQDLIKTAQDKAGTGFVETEKYIRDIARNRRRWEEKVARIKQTDKTLETITDKYQNELSEIQSLRKKMLTQARQEAQQILDEANKKIENAIKEIKESQAEKERTRVVREDIKQLRETLNNEVSGEEDLRIARKMEQLRKRQEENEKRKRLRAGNKAEAAFRPKEDPGKDLPLVIGDKVKIKESGMAGEIIRINGKKFSVGIGQIVTHLEEDKLERISRNEYKSRTVKPTNVTGSSSFDLSSRRLNFTSHIDIRGMRPGEALETVSRFIDDALMVGVGQVSILHGTGTGVLRTEVRNYLRSAPGVSSFEDEHVERGGSGITVVYLE